MSSCWPECSPWCVCVDGVCRPSNLTVNAVRIRTVDGRYLQALNGGGFYLTPVAVASPGAWETFLLDPPATWPLVSGSQIALQVVNASWRPSGNVVRVEHGARRLPGSKKSPGLVTYQIGGPNQAVLVRGPFGAGYPAYPGDDPAERTFTVTKIVGGNAAPSGHSNHDGRPSHLQLCQPESRRARTVLETDRTGQPTPYRWRWAPQRPGALDFHCRVQRGPRRSRLAASGRAVPGLCVRHRLGHASRRRSRNRRRAGYRAPTQRAVCRHDSTSTGWRESDGSCGAHGLCTGRRAQLHTHRPHSARGPRRPLSDDNGQ